MFLAGVTNVLVILVSFYGERVGLSCASSFTTNSGSLSLRMNAGGPFDIQAYCSSKAACGFEQRRTDQLLVIIGAFALARTTSFASISPAIVGVTALPATAAGISAAP
jgi:hypothetical protein